jgi:hypothetical protein
MIAPRDADAFSSSDDDDALVVLPLTDAAGEAIPANAAAPDMTEDIAALVLERANGFARGTRLTQITRSDEQRLNDRNTIAARFEKYIKAAVRSTRDPKTGGYGTFADFVLNPQFFFGVVDVLTAARNQPTLELHGAGRLPWVAMGAKQLTERMIGAHKKLLKKFSREALAAAVDEKVRQWLEHMRENQQKRTVTRTKTSEIRAENALMQTKLQMLLQMQQAPPPPTREGMAAAAAVALRNVDPDGAGLLPACLRPAHERPAPPGDAAAAATRAAAAPAAPVAATAAAVAAAAAAAAATPQTAARKPRKLRNPDAAPGDSSDEESAGDDDADSDDEGAALTQGGAHKNKRAANKKAKAAPRRAAQAAAAPAGKRKS